MVLDTSIAIKWIKQLNEQDSDKAYSLYQKIQSEEIGAIAPDLMLYELANYISRQKEEIFEECQDIILGIFESKIEIVPPDQALIQRATVIAKNSKISAYDATYLAVAERYKTKLVTADKKLQDKAPSLTISL